MGVCLWDNVWHRRGGNMGQVDLDTALAAGREAVSRCELKPYTTGVISEPRDVTVKGIAEPVQVVSISWK